MFVGDITRIKLGDSSFESVITNGVLYVDKSMFIEHFLKEEPYVQLIARQRRLGKSLNMDMLRCFLTDQTDYRPLFEHLQIHNSEVWGRANSAPVFHFDFKHLDNNDYKNQIFGMVKDYTLKYVNDSKCPQVYVEAYNELAAGKRSEVDSLLLLTAIAYTVTGKKSYILIDEYDEMLMKNMHNERYHEMRDFITLLFSSALKGNKFLEKALLTGVTRISYEGMLSGLNNLQTYDVFRDSVYAEDYGLTEVEVTELSAARYFDIDEARRWYNGVKIGGRAIYNMYSVMSMLHFKTFDCYWGASGSMGAIVSIMSASRKRAIIGLLDEGAVKNVILEEKISPVQLMAGNSDSMFYSFLVQTGYLSLEEKNQTAGKVAIPNLELQDVWKRFLLSNFFSLTGNMDSLFIHLEDPEGLAAAVETYLSNTLDALSYHDLPRFKGADGKRRVPENNYHILLYAILTAGKDLFQYEAIRSNRESGDGRYDIMVEFADRAVIFEIKSAADDEDMDEIAQAALRQIKNMRYGADLNKPIMGVGCAFRKKTCAVVADEIV